MRRDRGEAVAVTARIGPRGNGNWSARQPDNPILAETLSRGLQPAGRAIGQQIRVVSAGTEREMDAAFAGLVQQGVGALVVSNDPFFNSRPDQLVALAARHAVPVIYPYREQMD